jgi:glycosyltransferase involved in cell wall biosynthesis
MQNKRGWLINDTLTCIPGTKTFWHNLLEWVPGLEDKTNGLTPFGVLPGKIEQEAAAGSPDYIIRNATFFRKLNIKTRTISFLQDCYDGHAREQQVDVINSSDHVVFNSPYTHSKYKALLSESIPYSIISIGTDFNLFSRLDKEQCMREMDILPNSILFIGDSSTYPKGFDVVRQLISSTDFNFCLVMKDGFRLQHPRVRVFNRVGHDVLRKIISACAVAICTSKVETQHLSSIEAGACGLPVLTSDVGIYYGLEDGAWGHKCHSVDDFISRAHRAINNPEAYSPREFLLSMGLDLDGCKNKWLQVIGGNI